MLRRTVLLLGVVLLSGNAIAKKKPQAEAPAEELRYEVTLEGLKKDELAKALEPSLRTFALQDRPPATMAQLEQRVEGDTAFITNTLRSLGFYAADVTQVITPEPLPVKVTFRVNKGPQYRLGSVTARYTVDDVSALPPLNPSLKIGHPIRAERVKGGERAMLGALANQGYPFATLVARRVDIDHDQQAIHLELLIAPGPETTFGEVSIEGLKRVREKHVRAFMLWNEGDIYDQRRIKWFEDRLIMSQLFGTARIERPDRPEPSGALPMQLRLSERKHRTVRVGAEYQSDTGPGASLNWQHRNFLHHGERAHVGLVFSEIEGAASAGLERFNFFRIDQSVALNLRTARETTDAYDADKLDTAVTATRYFGLTNKLLRAGLAYGYSDSLQAGVETIAQLASIPLDGVWDTRDDLLDPSRGYQLVGQFRPYADVVNDELRFQSFFGDARTYVRIRHSKPRIIWAIRGASGVLTGADRYDIPPDIRFYAGGGGSVRGYAYQSLGDHVEGQPVGGNSLIELSNELRFKLSKTWGVVAFVDGGNVFATSTPDWEEGLSWGTGLGVRYHTPIGPVRADVAVPLERREDIDETYQFYISLGQAF